MANMTRTPAMAAARQAKLLGRTAPAASATRPIFSWFFGGAKDESAAVADTSIYEVRAYHHGENWTADKVARYKDQVMEYVISPATFDVKAFYVAAADDAETRTKASAAEILSGELPTEDDGTGFPTVVWVAKHESKEARDEAFGAFLGSENGQKLLSESPFNGDPPLLQGYEKIEEHFFRQPLVNIPNFVDPNGGKIHEVRTYYFPFDEYMAGDGKAYEEWAAPFFEALASDPLWKDKVRVAWTRGYGENAIPSVLTSGPHMLDPENYPEPPPAELLQPGITWACQWNSVEEKDAAWEKLFGEVMPKYFAEGCGNPMSKTGQLEGYKKLRVQFMESWV